MSPSVDAACAGSQPGSVVWEVQAVPSRMSPSPLQPTCAAPAKPAAPVRVGVKRSGASAFAPFPAARPAQRPRCASDLTGSGCDTASASASALRRMASTASDCAQSVESTGAAATPRSADSPQAQLLRLACTVLPKLRASHPAAAALLTAQLRATILRGAVARAGRSVATLDAQPSTASLPSSLPSRGSALARADSAVLARGVAFIQAGLPTGDVAQLHAARSFLSTFPAA